MANAQRQMQGEKWPSFSPFLEGQNGQGAFRERSLRTLRLIFFILGGRRDFYNFLDNEKPGP
jgi:hypothetical protein